jgi:ferredoxin
MIIEADPDRCCGSGMCAVLASDLFDQSEYDGTVIVLQHEVPPDRQAVARECIHNCPSGAISVRSADDAGRQQRRRRLGTP